MAGSHPTKRPLSADPGAPKGQTSPLPKNKPPPPRKKKKKNRNSLSSLILLRAPPAFSALWMLVKPFVDPVTADKVRFVGSLPAMRRLMARLMCGQAAAEAAEEAERRRAQIERRRPRDNNKRKSAPPAGQTEQAGEGSQGRVKEQEQDGRQQEQEQEQEREQQQEDGEERVPAHLAAAAREVERALRLLPAAVVGEGFGMPDAGVPPIDAVTARLVAAGRLARERREDGEEEEEGAPEEDAAAARPEEDAAAAAASATIAAAAAAAETAQPAEPAALVIAAPPPPGAESRLRGLLRRMAPKTALDALRL